MRHRLWANGLAWFGFGIALGAVSSGTWSQAMWVDGAAAGRASLSDAVLTARGDPSAGSRGYASTYVVACGSDSARFLVRATTEAAHEDGDSLRAVGSYRRFDDPYDSWSRARFMKGEVGSVEVKRAQLLDRRLSDIGPIQAARRSIIDAMDPASSDARALLAGVVCGRTTELNASSVSEAFSQTGLTHLVAVSGGHLAIIAGALASLLDRSPLRRRGRSAILLVLMACYVVFTGCAASAVRSVIMVGASMASRCGSRRAHALSGLSIAVMGILLASPSSVWDLGFQLSALSVLFICVFSTYIGCILQRLRIPGALADQLSMTVTAQWATMPLTVPLFETVSLISPLANVVVGPIMTALLAIGLVAAPLSAAVPWVHPLALSVADGIANVSIFAARSLADLPFSSIPMAGDAWLGVCLYGLAIVAYALWRDVRARAVAASCLLLLVLGAGHMARWMLFAPPSVVILSVGQADAILVRDGGRALLVDAGVDEAVVSALARNNVYRLDAVLITHWDRDHWGGLPAILESIPVDRVLVAEGASEACPAEIELDRRGASLVELALHDTVRIGRFSCRSVWPREPVRGEENGESLCLDIEFRAGSKRLDVLMTGDTEAPEAREYVGDVGDVDVLKLGHHGSKASVDAGVLEALDPEVCVASAGEGNSYGHPSKACRELVGEYGARFLCTKDDGDVTIAPGSGGPRVSVSGSGAA